jgi:hypothetical protein
MVLLPIFMAVAIGILLYILRRERHERALGNATPRPLYVNMALGLFASIGVFYLIVYLVSSLIA